MLSKPQSTLLFQLAQPILAAFAFLALLGLLSGCTNNPFESDKAKADDDKTDSSFILAQGLLQGSAKAASDMHQEIAAGDRVQERQSASEDAEVNPEVGVKTIGVAKGDPNLSRGTRPRSVAAGALLKRAYSLALGKRSAAGDSSTLVLADSAAGFVYSLRVYAFLDSASGGKPRPGNGRDSTIYRWPHNPENPAVLGFHRLRAFDDGVTERSVAYDDDGDGLLSEAPAGKVVRLRREWVLSRGDSLWKSMALTEHGQTTHFDSLGAGKARTWSDTLRVGGRLSWYRKIYDADGDSFLATSAAGAKVKIGLDSYTDLGGGLIRMSSETHGPGPDGDYEKDADNERYAASAYTVNDKGEDVNRSESGDADGDGLLWSPAAGAANRVWETAVYFRRSGMKSYKDSLVKVLGGGRESDARVVLYGAAYEGMDGTAASVSVAPLDGKTPFGPSDTVLVSERIVHPAGDAEGRDSTVRTAHIIPGRLDAEEDDKLIRWAVKDYFDAGSPLAERSESFASAAPMTPGTEATAGSLVVEEKRRGVGPADVVRVWKRNDFDKVAGTAAWREIRNAKSGDSSVTSGVKTGKGGGTYASHAGKGLKESGWYDPATGAFRDTVTWVDAKGAEIGKRTQAGTLKDGVGEYAVTVVRADGKSSEVRVAGSRPADGARVLTRMAGPDTSRIAVRGDTATQERAFGKAKVHFTCARTGAGAYQLDFSGKGETGKLMITGALSFIAEGSGSGELVEYAAGVAKAPVSFLSEPDGRVLVGGKFIP